MSEKIQCSHIKENGKQCGNKKLKENIPRDKRENWKCHQHRESSKENKANRRNSRGLLKEKAAEMLANPEITTNKEVYTSLGIPESTFYDWMNDQEFIDLVNAKVDKFTDRELPDVWAALIYNATVERDTKAIKLFFEMKGKYKQNIDVTTKAREISDMTEEEKKKKLQELEKKFGDK